MPAVLLDLYNTLVPGGDAERDTLVADCARDVGADPAVLVELFHSSWPWRMTGQLGSVEETLHTLAVRAGAAPTPSRVRLAAARRRSFTRSQLWPSAGTLAALASLRSLGWRLGVVTNCTIETAELWSTTPLSTHVDAAVFSSVLGVGKPDPAIYLSACSLLGVAPQECVYVGDGADRELPTAAQLGMTVIRTVEYVAADSSWPPTRIRSLSELPALLGAPFVGAAPPPSPVGAQVAPGPAPVAPHAPVSPRVAPQVAPVEAGPSADPFAQVRP
ncbi:hypothetical protein GCM10009682_16990 [Luedemannella flava]|uniref:HAD family hydrolase n=1 Tax=Luedemannella flava TaxID=349316 RepID=A0ABN2LPM5_9ACTN